MIHKIKKIKNLGIFSDWKSPDDITFKNYNLIYGFNGTGKSTLTKLFSSIEHNKNNIAFNNLEFNIELDSGITLDEQYKNIPPTIRVFNEEFVKENALFEKGTTQSIIYIGKENAELKKEIDELKQTEKQLAEKHNIVFEGLKSNTRTKDVFFTNTATILRTFFSQTVFSSLNYDKRSSEKIWEEVRKGASLNDFIFVTEALESRRQFIAQGQSKAKIELQIDYIPQEDGIILYQEVLALTGRNPAIETIERLKANPDISQWAQKGLEIHKKHNSLSCEFCNQPLPDGKLNTIEQHFSEDFYNLQNDIAKKIKELKAKFIPILSIDNKLFISDFASACDYHIEQINENSLRYNEGLQFHINVLEEKTKNPLQVSFSSTNIIPGILINYNSAVKLLLDLINRHNEIVSDFSKHAEENKLEIEKHFIAVEAINQSLLDLIGKIVIAEKELDDISKKMPLLQDNIKSNEIKLQDEYLPIHEINENLNKFLGRREISLDKNKDGGYLIKREDKLALNLSEGEKTAITLIYFIVKLKENNNDVKNTIVVFDDPISSLDSNHLFNAAHYIKSEFYSEDDEESKVNQLFILTHNFQFFSLVKEWATRETNIFNIVSINDNGNRKSTIEKADIALTNFNSEYHFLFSQIKQYCESEDKSYYHTHTISNISRQVLESFLSFKYGRKKLDKCFNEIKGFDDLSKVQKFVNHYSHRANHGDSIKGFNDNVFAESQTIVPLVLKLIEHVDETHYKSMINRLNNR